MNLGAEIDQNQLFGGLCRWTRPILVTYQEARTARACPQKLRAGSCLPLLMKLSFTARILRSALCYRSIKPGPDSSSLRNATEPADNEICYESAPSIIAYLSNYYDSNTMKQVTNCRGFLVFFLILSRICAVKYVGTQGHAQFPARSQPPNIGKDPPVALHSHTPVKLVKMSYDPTMYGRLALPAYISVFRQ